MMSGDSLRFDRSLGGLGKDDQLDRLLAGLDELSGTLPDLGRSAGVHQSAGVNHQLVNNHYQSLNQRNQLSASRETSILSDCPDNLPNRRVSDLTKQMSDAARRLSDNSRRLSNDSRHGSENVRTYEDDLDYVLEKEQNEPPVKGQERRPLIGVENYGSAYQRPAGVAVGGGGGGGGGDGGGVGGVNKPTASEPQPYHTRYDSKPFSYIRQNPSRPSSRAPSRCSSRDGLDGGRGRGLESPSLLRRMMGGPMDSDTPPSSPLPPRLQSVSPAPSSRDGETNPWTNWIYQSTKFVQPQTFQSVHNTENIYSKIGAGRTQSLDRSGLQERRTPERTVLSVRNLTPESRNRTPERIIPIQSVNGRIRTQSLGRGEGLMDEIGTRETIHIQTRDRSGSDTHSQGQTNGFRNGMSQNGGSQFKIERSLNASVHMNGMKGIKADENMRRGLDDLEDGLDGMRDERSRSEEDRETWLQKQQRKLQERRLVPPGHQFSNQPGVNPSRPGSATQPGAHPSNPVIQELKTSLYRARSGYTETTDGYVSDGNSVFMSETSRESSPSKQTYHVPQRLEAGSSNSLNISNLSHNSSLSSNMFNSSSVHSLTMNNASLNNSSYSTINSKPVNKFNNHDISKVSNNFQTDEHENINSSIYSSVNKKNSYTTPSGIYVSRQNSDTSFDRSRPTLQRKRHESENEAELDMLRNGYFNQPGSSSSSRPVTPGFPIISSTPYFNQTANTLPPRIPGSRGGSRIDLTSRAPSPVGSVYQGEGLVGSRRGSVSSEARRGSVSSEPSDIPPSHVKIVKDNYKFWYKKNITREEAISLLQDQQPGTFLVRDSNSFPGAFGLALKVSSIPPTKEVSNELVRHFLIEPTEKGVKLKGYSNEPVFASLSALIYQHTITALALPCRLVIPLEDLGGNQVETNHPELVQLLQYGAACNVFYLFSQDTDQLTGPQAVRKTVSQLILTRPLPSPTTVHFKVSGQGITLTDQSRKLFFRKHYSVAQISHCGVDPEDRRWTLKNTDGTDRSMRLFAFVARKQSSSPCNQCHVFAELDPEQPARAIVNFVNKLMLSGQTPLSNSRPADMV